MDTVTEIEKSILRLPPAECVRLVEWLSELMQTPRRVAESAKAYAALEDFPLTLEEYLEYEEQSRVRHEYLAGEIFAMTGVTKEHNRIAGRLYLALANHLKGTPCEPFISDVKVRLQVNRDNYVYYPDVMVVCDRELGEERYVANPKLIIEVLSPSTAGVDRHEKRVNYRWIPALEEYVVVAQERTEVTIFRRAEEWQPVALESLEATLELYSINLHLPLARIYQPGADA